MTKPSRINRRQLFRRGGLIAALPLAGSWTSLAAPASRPTTSTHSADSRILGPVPGMPANLSSCSLMPSATEGPYYFNAALVRSDMTEGRQGLPLFLQLQVVRVSGSGSTPVAGAIVDLWHCDADGLYSGYPGQLNNLDTQGDNFLRAIQTTDSGGNVTFQTIYPGWYPGRTVHIHVKVHSGGRTVTSQLYFPDAPSDEVFDTVEAYRARGSQGRTKNAQDRIYTPATVMSLSPAGGAYVATFCIGIA